MGAPPVPRAPAGGPTGRARPDPVVQDFLARAVARGRTSGGGRHRDHVLPLTAPMARLLRREPGTLVTVRMRRADALPLVIRTWRGEPEILRALHGVLRNVPECLAEGEGYAIHSHVDGVPFAGVCPPGEPVGPDRLRALADLLASVLQVRGGALPPLPACWPGNHTDSRGFLRTLARLADHQVRQANWSRYGGLFAALGVPGDALLGFAERVPAMTRRPYGLFHGDLCRDSLVLVRADGPELHCVDWELAGYGDPLHDLAVHLVRMRHPERQWPEVVDAWAVAVRRVRPAAVAGLARDLRHYVAFERARSVFADVIRAVRSLEETFDQPRLAAATAAVHSALEAAAEPLRLGRVPGSREIERVLFRRCAALAAAGAAGRAGPVTPTGVDRRTQAGPVVDPVPFGPVPFVGRAPAVGPASAVVRTPAVDWVPDRRVPEHPRFSHAAVRAALDLEGAAPAGLVFKGTAHLNSVVRVPDTALPVIVRREMAGVCRRERSFLSEHAVLRAIERSGVPVAAPRVLALGESHARHPEHGYAGDRFAVHTYEGPDDPARGPEHPADGLLPHEADRLVDQLAALTRVDYAQVDPVAGPLPGFYAWLSDQLVTLVAGLPADVQRVARSLGLPDAPRLRAILARHQVTDRAPGLLHGDLNPWNLVRRDDFLALTLIDWEMALVGDPLYELVRHMHLTPTRSEIRDRMFRRWERLLAPRYTRNWRRDWRVYRWIEIVRSAYVDLDRLVTGASLDAPNVRRAVESYAMTLAAATASLGLPPRPFGPNITRALARPTGPRGSA